LTSQLSEELSESRNDLKALEDYVNEKGSASLAMCEDLAARAVAVDAKQETCQAECGELQDEVSSLSCAQGKMSFALSEAGSTAAAMHKEACQEAELARQAAHEAAEKSMKSMHGCWSGELVELRRDFSSELSAVSDAAAHVKSQASTTARSLSLLETESSRLAGALSVVGPVQKPRLAFPTCVSSAVRGTETWAWREDRHRR